MDVSCASTPCVAGCSTSDSGPACFPPLLDPLCFRGVVELSVAGVGVAVDFGATTEPSQLARDEYGPGAISRKKVVPERRTSGDNAAASSSSEAPWGPDGGRMLEMEPQDGCKMNSGQRVHRAWRQGINIECEPESSPQAQIPFALPPRAPESCSRTVGVCDFAASQNREK